MASILSFLISSGSKKKEPRYVCLSEAKASHSHRMWTEVSSSAPHFLQMGLLLSPILYRCLLKALFPVNRPGESRKSATISLSKRTLFYGDNRLFSLLFLYIYIYVWRCDAITNIYFSNTKQDISAHCRRCVFPNFGCASSFGNSLRTVTYRQLNSGNLYPEGMKLYEYGPNFNWVCVARDAEEVKCNFYEAFGI